MLNNASTATGALYIANCTKQGNQFEYRLGGAKTPRRHYIESLTQVNVGGRNGLTGMEIEQIVKQHRKFGLVSVNEIDHTKPFFGLVYSTDKPVTVGQLQLAIVHNDEVLMDRGREIRKAAALATDMGLKGNETLKKMGANVEEVEMTVIEQETKSNPDPEFAESVIVSEDADGEGGRKSGKGGKGKGKGRGR
jgi:hypothetical protein